MHLIRSEEKNTATLLLIEKELGLTNFLTHLFMMIIAGICNTFGNGRADGLLGNGVT